MRTAILLVILLLFTQQISAQQQVVNPLAKLSTLHVYEKDLLVNLLPPDTGYSFYYDVLNEYADTTYGFKAGFNPKNNPGWYMRIDSMQLSSETELTELEKRITLSGDSALPIIIKNIEGAAAVYYYIVQFTVDSNNLPPAYSYLKYCKATAYINMPNKDLEKIVWENTKSFRYKDINVSSFHLDVYPDFIDGKYRVIKEWVEITGRKTNELKEFHETYLYSNYKKL